MLVRWYLVVFEIFGLAVVFGDWLLSLVTWLDWGLGGYLGCLLMYSFGCVERMIWMVFGLASSPRGLAGLV